MPHLFIVCCRGVVRIQEKAARTTTTRGLKRRSREFASLIPNLRAAANWMEQSRRDAGGAGRGRPRESTIPVQCGVKRNGDEFLSSRL